MHLIRLDENSVIEYSGTKEESEMGKNRENADQVIAELMKETALEVYGDQAESLWTLRHWRSEWKERRLFPQNL